jgi:hypothetical protein
MVAITDYKQLRLCSVVTAVVYEEIVNSLTREIIAKFPNYDATNTMLIKASLPRLVQSLRRSYARS